MIHLKLILSTLILIACYIITVLLISDINNIPLPYKMLLIILSLIIHSTLAAFVGIYFGSKDK